MTFASKTRRALAAALAVSAVTFGTVACSDATNHTNAEANNSTITITHSMGQTDVPKNPKRIVTMSSTWTDALMSLDVPITAEVVSTSMNGTQRFPWQDASAFTDTERIEYGMDMNDVSIEKILALKPDVILAGWVPDKKFYDRLSDIAPTVPVLQKDTGVDDWHEITRLAGRITGKEEQAEQLVKTVDDKFAENKKDLPNLQGKTFTWGMYVGGSFSVVADQNDPSNEILSSLGMKVPEKQVQAAKGDARTSISAENVDLLNADFMLMWAIDGNPDNVPGYKELPVVKDKRTLRIGENESNATSLSSAASLMWAMDRIIPALKSINDGTAVQQLPDVASL
ncbi:ABC transporter substrate-binding protein [Corynebacterium anserum]|uniref:ABC transporter substrate-binding protein n=1 Tax=Corynebacterium anserum TaxID=2684406 RepID=A0A7G7YLH0_9CORY|nr:ABC transporter substrate-binding protein [Corynebacterium anserum]QNH95340.1 ABC transporter substrate-binding protein [Corynebacterium anserum]